MDDAEVGPLFRQQSATKVFSESDLDQITNDKNTRLVPVL